MKSTILKILFVIEFILILIIIILTLINNAYYQNLPTAYAVKENLSKGKNYFKAFTKAVCEEKTNHTFCRDELFIKCNGKDYMIKEEDLYNFTDCKGVKLNLSDVKVIGHAIFEKEWDDPRVKK